MGTPQRGRIRSRTNFVERGYSPNDGLGPGEWLPVPNSGGIVRWVGEHDDDEEDAA